MIRVGIGGWTYAPWRETFYPADLKQANELAYAAQNVTTIEINGTFYRTQSAASFRKWADATPDEFVFAVKGHRSVVNKSKLAESGDGIGWFFGSGVLELGDKLGPILWQLPPYKRFDTEDIETFFSLLPREVEGRTIHHVIEPRHNSFQDAGFVALARAANIAVVQVDSPKYPAISDLTGDVIYARFQDASAEEDYGYSEAVLDAFAARCRDWEDGKAMAEPPPLANPTPLQERPVFAYMINGAKEKAPAAAMALLERLKR